MGETMELRGGRRPQRVKTRRGRFTAEKKDRFFAELAATCNVTAACRRARVHPGTVYEHRGKDAAFRARWAEAVREGYAKLELMLIERAMNGTVKTVTRADGSVDKTHEFPNGVALTLLRLHRETAVEAQVRHDPEEVEEARRRIARKLERLSRQIEAEQAKEGGDRR